MSRGLKVRISEFIIYDRQILIGSQTLVAECRIFGIKF